MRRGARRKNTEPQIKQKVTRCKLTQSVKFEHETCKQFSGKQQASEQKTCVHCQYSF
jgi:hypothetical protein